MNFVQKKYEFRRISTKTKNKTEKTMTYKLKMCSIFRKPSYCFYSFFFLSNSLSGLEQERAHTSANLALLLHEYLEVLVDDGDRQQDTRAGADGAHEVRND